MNLTRVPSCRSKIDTKEARAARRAFDQCGASSLVAQLAADDAASVYAQAHTDCVLRRLRRRRQRRRRRRSLRGKSRLPAAQILGDVNSLEALSSRSDLAAVSPQKTLGHVRSRLSLRPYLPVAIPLTRERRATSRTTSCSEFPTSTYLNLALFIQHKSQSRTPEPPSAPPQASLAPSKSRA